MKKLVCLLFVALFLFSGCSVLEQIAEYNLEQLSKSEEKTEKVVYSLPESDYVKSAIELAIDNPNSLNPIDPNPYSVDQLLKLVYDPLVTIDDHYNVIPKIAASYEQIQDTTYRVVIRDDVYFHNNVKLSVEDIVYTYERIVAIENSTYDYVVDYIESITIINETTLDIKFRILDQFNIYALTFPIISQTYMESEEYNPLIPVGTGGFKYKGFQDMIEVALKKNNRYFDTKAQAQEVIGTIVRSFSDSYNMFQARRVDLFGPKITDWEKYSEDSNIKSLYYYSPNYYYIGFNHNNDDLSIVEHRRSIASTIPYESIVKDVFLDHFYLTSLPINPQMNVISTLNDEYLLNDKTTYYGQYMTEEAYKHFINALNLIDESRVGQIRNDVSIVIRTPDIYLDGIYNLDDITHVKLIETLKSESIHSIYKIEWLGYSQEEYDQKVLNNEFDLFLASIKTSFIPDLKKLLDSNGVHNYGQYKSLNMDGLLATYNDISTESQLKLQLENFAKIISEDLPYIPLGFLENGLFLHSQVGGSLKPSYFNLYYNFQNLYPVNN